MHVSRRDPITHDFPEFCKHITEIHGFVFVPEDIAMAQDLHIRDHRTFGWDHDHDDLEEDARRALQEVGLRRLYR